MPPEKTTDRRKLLSILVGGISAGIGGSLAAVFGRFLGGAASTQQRLDQAGPSLGSLAAWPDGAGPVDRTLTFADRDGYYLENRRERVFLTRVGAEPVVFSATCTHLGCGVSWDAATRTFRCPCHGGVYRDDGSVASGPPPLPLRRLPIVIRNGEVFLAPGELA